VRTQRGTRRLRTQRPGGVVLSRASARPNQPPCVRVLAQVLVSSYSWYEALSCTSLYVTFTSLCLVTSLYSLYELGCTDKQSK